MLTCNTKPIEIMVGPGRVELPTSRLSEAVCEKIPGFPAYFWVVAKGLDIYCFLMRIKVKDH